MLEWKKVRILNGTKKYVNKIRKAVYYMASFLMPSILLFDLYNRNYLLNHIIFTHVLILAGILAIAGLLLFITFKNIVKSVEGALMLSLLSWSVFWLYERLLEVVRGVMPVQFFPSRVFALILMIVIVSMVIILRRYNLPFNKIGPAFNILAFSLIVMFIFNLIPSVSHERTLIRARSNSAQLQYEYSVYIKRDFHIEQSLPTPNIYWFHMDNVMSLEKVEEFWGLNYDHYRKEFEARGFLIYDEATLNAGTTSLAYSALFSPAFYDSFLGERLNHVNSIPNIGWTEEGSSRIDYLHGEFNRVGLEVRSGEVMLYRELFNALFARGYQLNIPYEYAGELPTSFEHLEDNTYSGVRGSMWREFLKSDLPRALSITTPLPMLSYIDGQDGREQVRHLRGIEPVAQFNYYPLYDAHMEMSVRDRVTEPKDGIPNEVRYDLYPSLGFESAIERVLEYIDDILERNPHAVIVLQSDHGFHLVALQVFMSEQGYSDEEIVGLMHSVFSAVRIPEEYGGLEKPIAPLNITRELVNRFVGKNYELLP